MADPNNLVLHEYRLGLMFICKAGNTSIKTALGETLRIQARSPHRIDLFYPSVDKMCMREYRQQGYLVLSVVRHPLARLVSCWADKIETRFHQPFARKYGDRFWPGMAFDAFVHTVADMPDGIADQHFRSMSWDLLAHDGEHIPQYLKIEHAGWWDDLRAKIVTHCGLDIGEQQQANRTGFGKHWREYYTPDTLSIARERYRTDFERFGYA